jgi:hypothetical protein
LINAKKGVSACQITRDIEGNYKTGWRILNRIRSTLSDQGFFTDENDIYVVDEIFTNAGVRKSNIKKPDQYDKALTYDENDPDVIATLEFLKEQKRKNKQAGNFSKKPSPKAKRGKGTKKQAVFGGVNTRTLKVFAKILEPNEKGERLTAEQMNEMLKSCIRATKATIVSDQSLSYEKVNELGFKHISINHQIAFEKAGVSTNLIECFWAIIARMIYGTYHHVAPKNLQHYIDECVFRFNRRLGKLFFEPDIFDDLLRRTILVAA